MDTQPVNVTEEMMQKPQDQSPAPQAPPPVETPRPEDDFSKKFATLTRKERELFQRERELKALQEKLSKYEQLEELKAKDPFKYIKEQGIEFDSVVNAALKADEPPSVDDKLKSLEEKIAAYEKQQAEKEKAAQAERERQAIDSFKKQIETTIKGNLEAYELINAQDEFETVFEVIQAHYQKTLEETGHGEVLPIEKAAAEVEGFLLERAKKLLGLKKLSAIQQPETESPKPKPEQSMAATLTASMTPAASAPTKLDYEFTPEGIERRKREAAKLIRWT